MHTYDDDSIVTKALEIMERRMSKAAGGIKFYDTAVVRSYAKLRFGALEHEAFGALWLSSQVELIAFDELFVGTLDRTSVYPREVVKAALHHNAAAVILIHNHPSGNSTPSEDDVRLTDLLRTALGFVDVEVLDHLVVGRTVGSFIDLGLIPVAGAQLRLAAAPQRGRSWHTAADLAGRPGYPSTKRGVAKRAAQQSWPERVTVRRGGATKEYAPPPTRRR